MPVENCNPRPTPARSNLSRYEGSSHLSCPVLSLLLDNADGDVWTNTNHLIVSERSLYMPGAYERVGFVEPRMETSLTDILTRITMGLEPTSLILVQEFRRVSAPSL